MRIWVALLVWFGYMAYATGNGVVPLFLFQSAASGGEVAEMEMASSWRDWMAVRFTSRLALPIAKANWLNTRSSDQTPLSDGRWPRCSVPELLRAASTPHSTSGPSTDDQPTRHDDVREPISCPGAGRVHGQRHIHQLEAHNLRRARIQVLWKNSSEPLNYYETNLYNQLSNDRSGAWMLGAMRCARRRKTE